jgi:hypothetical protein
MKKIIILGCFIFISLTILLGLNFFEGSGGEGMNKVDFEGKRISRSANIVLKGSIKDVFPLFGPIEETKWAHGWNPVVIYPTGKKVEKKMVFKVVHKDSHSGEEESIWIVSQYLPKKAFIEYTVIAKERVWLIAIQCKELGENQGTQANVTYTYTGLTEKGNNLCIKQMNKIYAHDLKDWEAAINYYLKTGKTFNSHNH